MANRTVLTTGALLLACLVGAQDLAGGWGLGSAYNRRYDPTSEVAFTGRVVGVHKMAPIAGMSPGLMILVRTPNGGTALVELGPTWYFDHQPFPVAIKDRVEVAGSKVFEGTKSSILARKIVRDNRVAYLRGVDGFPMWIASRGHVEVAGSGSARRPAVFEGTLQRFEDVDVGESGFPSRLLILQTADGVVAVDMGPRWFIERQNFPLELGGAVVVEALRVEPRAGRVPLVVAGTVIRGNASLVLRPQKGLPAWVGWRGGGDPVPSHDPTR